jgi:hypothetical protein
LTGADETLSSVRQQLPGRVRFLGYGHKLSFGVVARESLARLGLGKVVSGVADDVVAWNQLGCLSPHAVYVETGGAISSMDFAALLAQELEKREAREPRGAVPAETAAAISTRRMFYEVRASSAETTRIWSSAGSTAWTVVHEADPQFQLSCLNRFVYIKPVAEAEQVIPVIASLPGKISTVGLAAPIHRAQEIATRLAAAGVSRVCRLGRMQDPPLSWRHDGRPSLGDLVTWTDFEF